MESWKTQNIPSIVTFADMPVGFPSVIEVSFLAENDGTALHNRLTSFIS